MTPCCSALVSAVSTVGLAPLAAPSRARSGFQLSATALSTLSMSATVTQAPPLPMADLICSGRKAIHTPSSGA